MASIQKRGNKWVAEVRLVGKYRSKSFDAKGPAKDWADDEERKLRRKDTITQGKTLGQAMQRYMDEVTPEKKGARWEDIRLKKLMRDEIAAIQLTDLNADDIEDWMGLRKKAGLKGSSINRELNLLSAVLTKARKRWKWLDGHPMANVERPADPPSRDKTYSDDDISRILLALGYEGQVTTLRHKIAVAMLLALETAMRQGEIWGMTWEAINWEKCYVHLPETKNGDSRNVALSDKALALLQSMAPGKGRVFTMPQASAGVIYKRAMQLAEISGLTFHDLRHTATTRLAGKLDMLDLARMTGHRDPRNLLIYYNPKPHDIAKKLN